MPKAQHSRISSFSLCRIRGRFLHEHQFSLLPNHLHRQIIRVQSVPERGEFFRWQFVHEAEGGRGQVGAVFLKRQPAAVEFFRRAAGGVGAGEDVQPHASLDFRFQIPDG